jgi:hypothetical protein
MRAFPLGYVPSAKDVLEYYGSEGDSEVKEMIFEYSQYRQTMLVLDESAFGNRKRSVMLRSPDDIPNMAKATLSREENPMAPRKYPAFHGTVKKYRHPNAAGLREVQRIGADCVIDIDIKVGYKKAFRAGESVVRLYDKYDIPYFVKFSGGTGPHIIIPAEALPGDCGRFDDLCQRILEFVMRKTGAPGIDTSFSSPTHFLRLPYSIHERTGLVSIPLSEEQFHNFKPKMAEIPNVEVVQKFCEVSRQSVENLRNLIADAGGETKGRRRRFPFGRGKGQDLD